MNTLLSLTLDMTDITVFKILTILVVSTLLGLILRYVFIYTHRNDVYDKSFSQTLLLLPLVISIIIVLVSGNLATAFSLAGVFALVRFRTAIADSRDITYILSAVGIGLAIAMGFIDYAIVITVFISILLVTISMFQKDKTKSQTAKLKIIVPENLNYENLFDDIFKKHLENFQLQRVKTTDFGTMFELTYLVKCRIDLNQKALIDDIRVRNGNLNVQMTTDYQSIAE